MDVVLDLRVPPAGLLLVPMDRNEFYRLSEAEDFPRKSEWYDGLCVVTGPSLPHGLAAVELICLLNPLVSNDHYLLSEVGWDAPRANASRRTNIPVSSRSRTTCRRPRAARSCAACCSPRRTPLHCRRRPKS